MGKRHKTWLALPILLLSVSAFVLSLVIPVIAPAPFRVGLNITGIVSDSDFGSAIETSDVWIKSVSGGCTLANTSDQTKPTSPFYTNANGYYQTYNKNDKIAMDSSNTAKCYINVTAKKPGYVKNSADNSAFCGQLLLDMSKYKLGDTAQFTQSCSLQKNVKIIVKEYSTENVMAGNVADSVANVNQTLDANGVTYFGETTTPVTFTYSDPTDPPVHNVNNTQFTIDFEKQNVFTLYTKKHASLSTVVAFDKADVITEKNFTVTATIANGDLATAEASTVNATISFSPLACGIEDATTKSMANIAGGSSAQVTFNVQAKTEGLCTVTVTPDGMDAEDLRQAYISAGSNSINMIDPAPLWSNLTASPASPVVYSPGAIYYFSSTWIDNVAVDTVLFEFNGVNYTAVKDNDLYDLYLYDLGAGSYQYKWYANDTGGHWNFTDYFTYEILKATPQLHLELDGVESDKIVTYPTSTNVTGWSEDLQDLAFNLYRNDNSISSGSPAGDIGIQTAVIHTYVYNTSGGANYSAATVSRTLTVNKGNSSLLLEVDSGSGIYGATTTATCAQVAGDNGATLELRRDGSLVNTSTSGTVTESIILGANTYNYECKYLESANYFESVATNSTTVSRASPVLHLELNGVEGDNSVNYKNALNVTGWISSGDPSAVTTLLRDSITVSNPDQAELAAGAYVYNFTYDATENYTDGWASYTLTVNKTVPSLLLLLNDFNGDQSIQYSDSLNVTGLVSIGDASATTALYRNGTSVSNPDLTQLAAGTYEYNFTYDESANYTAAWASHILTVNKTPSRIRLLLDGIESDISIVFGTPVNVTGVVDAGDATAVVALDRDGTAVSNPDQSDLPGGVYKYTWTYDESENYTASLVSYNLTISTAANSVNLYINGILNGNATQIYGTDSNATATSLYGTVQLYQDGVAVSNPDIRTLGGGTYKYTANVSATVNYTAASQEFYLIVNPVTTIVTLYLNGNNNDTTITYGTQSNATGVSNIGTILLYRDGILVSNSEIATLGGGNYVYEANVTGNANYTSASQTFTLTVNKKLSSVDLYLNGNQSDLAVVYGTESNATAVGTNGNVVLYRDGIVASNSDVGTFGVGAYNYTAAIMEDQNTTGSSKTFFLTVNKIAPTIKLYLDSVEWTADDSRTYPFTTNVNGTVDVAGLQSSVILYRDSVAVSNPESVEFAAGTYTYNASFAGDANYSAVSVSRVLTINKAAGIANLTFSPVSPITYGTQHRATCTGNFDSAVTLYRDGQDVTSTENAVLVTLGAGTYNYNCTIAEGTNYTGNSAVASYTIDKQPSSVDLFLNGLQSDNNQTYGTPSTANATVNVSGLTVRLLRDSIQVASGVDSAMETTTLGGGAYNYTAVFDGNDNYTADSESFTLTITKGSADLRFFLNGNEADATQTYGTDSNATAYTEVGASVDLYRDGLLVNSGAPASEIKTLAAGTYNYNASFAGNQNYTAQFVSRILTINKAGVDVRLFLNGNESNLTLDGGAQSNATATINVSGLAVNLERDSALVSNSDVQTLSAGTYNYTAYFSGDENYTGDSTTYFLTINPLLTFIITIDSPQNITYQTEQIWTNATTDRNALWVNVSVDGGSYQLLGGSGTGWNSLLTFSEGLHNVVFSGLSNDSITNTTAAVYFTIPCLSNLTDTTVDGVYYASSRQNILTDVTTITCSDIKGSNVTNSTIRNSKVVNKILDTMIIEDSEVDPHYGISSKNSTINQGSNSSQSQVNHSTITGKSNVSDSQIIYSIINASNVTNSSVWWSNVLRSWVIDSLLNFSTVTDSYVRNSTVTSSTVTNSIINNSQVSDSTVIDSNVQYSTVTNSTVQGSTITNSNIANSWIYNSTLDGVTAGFANITNNQLINGWVVINGTNYTTPTNLTAASEGSDTTAPIINSLTVSNTTPNAGDTITLTINVTDNVGVANVTVNDTLANFSGGAWTFLLTLPSTDGDYQYYILAQDYAGNSASQNLGVSINTSATPQVNFDTEYPNVGLISPISTSSGNITFSFSAWDDTQIFECYLNVNSTFYLASGPPFVNGTAVANVVLSDGIYPAYASCSDSFNNTVNGTAINLTISTPPAPGPSGGGGGGGGGGFGFVPVTPVLVLEAPSPVRIVPGTTASFEITLKNIGNATADGLIITAQGLPVSWFILDTRASSLGINANITNRITINVPETEPIGSKSVTITASSKEGVRVSKTITLEITNVTQPEQPPTQPPTNTTGIISGITGALIGFVGNPMTLLASAGLIVSGFIYWIFRSGRFKLPRFNLPKAEEFKSEEQEFEVERKKKGRKYF